MDCMSLAKARSNLYNIVNERSKFYDPIIIMGKKNVAVIIGKDFWDDIQETLHLLKNKERPESNK